MTSRPLRTTAIALGSVLSVIGLFLAGFNVVEYSSGRIDINETRTFDELIDRVEVTTGSGDIEVSGRPQSSTTTAAAIINTTTTTTPAAGPPPDEIIQAPVEVNVRARGHFRSPKFVTELDGQVLKVKVDCLGIGNGCQAAFVLKVPQRTSVVAKTGSGNITTTDTAGSVELRSNSGDVSSHNASGDVFVHTSSGDAEVTGISAESVSAKTSSGNVSLEFTRSPGKVSGATGSGNVDIEIPQDESAYRVETKTSSGDEDVQVRTDPTSSKVISAKTGSGDVDIRYSR